MNALCKSIENTEYERLNEVETKHSKYNRFD